MNEQASAQNSQVLNPKNYYSYEAAQARVKEIGFRSQKQYTLGCRLDLRLPPNPINFYGKKFDGWIKFLGMCSLKEAMEIVRKEKCFNEMQYSRLLKLYPQLPVHPRIYGIKWASLRRFIRTAQNIQ